MRVWKLLAAALAAGAALVLAPSLAAAALTDSMTLRITETRGTDTLPPNAINDLQAAPNATEGQVILSWTAPADNPSGNVQSYQIRYSTFPVSVAGSTTSWWNGAVVFAGAPAPSPAGTFPEVAVVGSLPAGATYYFAIRSLDAVGNPSPLDAAATSGIQAHAVPKGVRPAPVAGLLALVNPDTTFDVNWDPVTKNEDGSAFSDFSDYTVLRSNNLTGPFSVTASSGVATSGFDFHASATPASVEYLKILARDTSGNTSDPATSNILEVTPQGIIGQLAVAPDGTISRSYLPAAAMGELKRSSGDLLMKVSPDVDPALNRDPRKLSTYDVSFVSPVQVVDKNFALSRPSMNVVLSYNPPAPNASVGVMWWNGTAWIRISDAQVDPVLKTVSFYTGLPGTYQVRTFQAPSELTLDKANVFPRIFTPNGDGINDIVLFVVENPKDSSIDGKIYDIGGNEVATLAPAGVGAPTPDTLMWNGRDRDGRLVRSGVYIYRIKGEGKSFTGTVVVAK